MIDDLHAMLDAFAARIDKTRSELKTKQARHDKHRLTAGEFEARHNYLKKEFEGEISDPEAHCHRDSNIELSVRQRFDSLEL